MNRLLNQISPLTRGIIWSISESSLHQHPWYTEVDYLVNGLLTSTLNCSSQLPIILVSENFGQNFFVFIGELDATPSIQSYFNLVQPTITGENHLIMLDSNESFNRLPQIAPKETISRIQVFR